MAKWDEKKIERLRRMWADPTMRVKEMAEGLGMTPGAVSQQAWRLGLPSRYPARSANRKDAAA